MKSDHARALREIGREMTRQDDLWGIQDHPDFYEDSTAFRREYAMPFAKQVQDDCAEDARQGTPNWGRIAFEEVLEAFQEEDPRRMRDELIQAAAVFTQWALAIDRRVD